MKLCGVIQSCELTEPVYDAERILNLEATLTEILNAREERMREQKEMISLYGKPLVSFTMNIAGPVKNSLLIQKAFEEGMAQLDKRLKANKFKVIECRQKRAVTGCEALYAVSLEDAKQMSSGSSAADEEAVLLKSICISIEEGSGLGRLFDMDVISPEGRKLERAVERKCLICGASGKGCASRRIHSVSELMEKTKEIISAYFENTENGCSAEAEADRVSEMVTDALMEEVLTTPKPGLVDRNNNGSHEDMDIETFRISAQALRDYWKRCFLIGYETSAGSPQDTFLQLRAEGLNAEKEMFRATGGVNTHKGSIFLMGTVCGAIGRLWYPEPGKTEVTERDNYKEYIDPVRIAEECSEMTKHIMKRELERLTERSSDNGTEKNAGKSSQINDLKTAGEKIWVSYGFKGARGELSDGLPGVVKTSLPVFRMLLSDGADRNAAGAGAFVALIARGSDTNMIKRGGISEAEKAAQQAMVIVREKKLLDTGSIEQLDEKFIALNLSPGGCADLLAITYFLNDYSIEYKTENT